MKPERSISPLFLGMLIVSVAVVLFAWPVAAQAPLCPDPQHPGSLIPCPSSGGQPGNPPTSVHIIKLPTRTPTSLPTQIPTSTEVPIPPVSGGPGSNNPSSLLPAIQEPDQGSSPFSFPGPLGMIIAVLIIVVCIIGGFFLVGRRRKIGSTGGVGTLPYMEKGGNESATMTVHDIGHFDEGSGGSHSIDWGDHESATIAVHDLNDISPDAASSAREAASDPGSGLKPPSPNNPGGGKL